MEEDLIQKIDEQFKTIEQHEVASFVNAILDMLVGKDPITQYMVIKFVKEKTGLPTAMLQNELKTKSRKGPKEDQVLTNITNLKLDSYQDNVELFHKQQPFFYDRAGIFWFWDHEEFKYKIVDDVDIMLSIDTAFEFRGTTVSRGIKSGYMEAFRRIGRLNKPKDPPKTWVQFKDTIIDLTNSDEMEASPEYFFTNPIPWELGESEETPVLDRIFTEWVGEDNKQMLYEIAAFSILPDYVLSRIFCFLGAGSNGKSKYLELVRKFVGDINTTTTDLSTLLNSRFEKGRLHKKLVCLLGETNFNTMSRTDLLKKLCSGTDLIGFEYKNKGLYEDVNYAKILIATNSIPDTTDRTDGFYRRWVIIDFPNQFTEKVDIMAMIPDQEYKNLALKCIRLGRDLLLKRQFTNEGSLADRRKRYEDRSNPLQKFYNDNVEDNYDAHISKRQFKEKVDQWCKENRFRIMSDRTIAAFMKEKGLSSGKVQATWEVQDGKKIRYNAWLDVKWKE
jgi:P4 family phage/plasmid primase-like protien